MEKNLIEWTDMYSVGYKEIDNQHKKLIDIINELYAGFKQRAISSTIEKIIMELIQYTDYHFKTEENYFLKYNYSETKKHVAEHLLFVDQVLEYFDEFKEGSVTISYDLMDFLRGWLLDHILGEDKKFGAEFKSKNIIAL